MAHSSIVSRSSSRRDSLLILSGALAGASASALLFYRALRRRARSLAMERAGRSRLERELRDLGLKLEPPLRGMLEPMLADDPNRPSSRAAVPADQSSSQLLLLDFTASAPYVDTKHSGFRYISIRIDTN